MAKTKTKAKAKSRTKASAKTGGFTTLVDLTPAELKKLPRPRDGFERHVASMLAVLADYGDRLGRVAVDPPEVRGRLAAWGQLDAIEAQARKHLEMIEETRSLNASKVWSAMLEIYARAQVVARTDDEVRRAIADFAGFMALGPRKKPAAAAQ